MATLGEQELSWRRELEREIRLLAPHWEDPEADWAFTRRVLGAPRRIPRPWVPWAQYGAAAALAGVLIVLVRPQPVRAPAVSPTVMATLSQEASIVLNQPKLTGFEAHQTGPRTIVLTNDQTGSRWQYMTFQRQGDGKWIPIALQSRIAGLSVTFTVVTGLPGFVLPYAAQRRVEARINALPYTSRDSQQGALDRLPINLAGARVGMGVGQAKVDLHLPGLMIRALTYMSQVHGHTVFYPMGWYWMKGGPTFLALPLTPPNSLGPMTHSTNSTQSPGSPSGNGSP